MMLFPSLDRFRSSHPAREQATLTGTPPATTEIELQPPAPAHVPRRDSLIRPEPYLSMDEFLRSDDSASNRSFNIFRDIEAQMNTLPYDQETLPPFDLPPTYDEAVPAPRYRAGFKQNLKQHAGTIMFAGGVLSTLALITLVSLMLSGKKAGGAASLPNTH